MNIVSNTKINFIGSSIPIIIALALSPVIYANISEAQFGVLLIIWGILGYLSFFDFGIGKALTFEISQRQEEGPALAGLVTSGILLSLFLSCLVVGAAYFALEAFGPLWRGRDGAAVIEDAALFWLVLCILPTLMLVTMRGTLEGLNRFLHSNILRIGSATSIYLFPVFFIRDGVLDMTALCIGYFLIRLSLFLFSIWAVRHHLTFGALKTGHLRDIARYASWAFLAGIVAPYLIFSDRFVMPGVVPAADIVYYALPQELIIKFLILPGAFANAFFYEISSGQVNRKRYNSIMKKYLLFFSAMFTIIFAVAPFIMAPVYSLFFDSVFAERAYIPTLIVLVAIFFNTIGLFFLVELQATGRMRHVFAIYLFEATLVTLVYLFHTPDTIEGFALLWAARGLLDGILAWLLTRRAGGGPLRKEADSACTHEWNGEGS